MSVDPKSGVPKRAQLAAILRDRIRSGQIPVGGHVPSGPALHDEFGVSRDTADRALNELAAEGLIERVTGIGSIVISAGEPHAIIKIGAGTRVTARMPTSAERRALAIPAGVPLLAVAGPGGGEELHAADRVVILATGLPRRR